MLAAILSTGLCVGILAASPAKAGPAPRAGSIDLRQAAAILKEVQAISDRDGGKMWGKPLYGATLFVDENTRDLVANRPDFQGLLKAEGELFTGTLPAEENVANTAVRWGGVEWTMVHWPLPEDVFGRDKLLIHESFHRIQASLGLDGPDTPCDHLDTRDGRLWLQLEWRALEKALISKKEGRARAVVDALIFRARRRALIPDSAGKEQALEMHEGLPEYTGVALCARNRAEAEAYAAAALDYAPSFQTFVRSFAYASGPAYGLLLDDAKPGWRAGLKGSDDLGALLGAAAGFNVPEDLAAAAESRAAAYGGRELEASETARAAEHEKLVAAVRKRFVEGAVLFIPLREAFSYSFDPTNQVPLEGVGTVYPYLRISGPWGILEAQKGALLLKKEGYISGVKVLVPKDAASPPLAGPGWTLTLNEGYRVEPGDRKGDFEVRRSLLNLP